MKKSLITVLVFLWIIGCSTTQSPKMPITVNLYSIGMGLDVTRTPTDSCIVEWYYPLGITFGFMIIGSTTDTTMAYFFENRITGDSITYGRLRMLYRGKEYKLFARNTPTISAGDSSYFNTWNISLPIFDSVYTKHEMGNFLKNIVAEATYFWLPNWADYKKAPHPNGEYVTQLYEVFEKAGVALPDTIPISIDKELWFYAAIDATEIPLEQVGYPFEIVPDSVKPPHPINGIPW